MTTSWQESRVAAGQSVSVISVLLDQHVRISELFALVSASHGRLKQEAFDQLRELLAVHEAGEEMVLRPVSTRILGEQAAQARNDEEKQATTTLSALEKLDVDDAEFIDRFDAFERAVTAHADLEESEEFPRVLAECGQEQLERMALRLVEAQSAAPGHPHPLIAGSTQAQCLAGPFVALLDKARDALARTSADD